MVPEPRELLEVAVQAAEAGAAELRTSFGQVAAGVRTKSTPTDLVSDVDLGAEAAIRRVLAQRRPGDGVFGEEQGDSGQGELRWVVDPLDGTINFLFGIPVFAVSVACQDASGEIVGVVIDPVRGERFAAVRGGAATLDGQPIAPPPRPGGLGLALVATGFHYDSRIRAGQAAVLARLLPEVRDIRRVGSAALDLCWCACGRYDAFYERGLHDWDLAAGALIARRAGLEVRTLPARGEELEGVLAAPARLVDGLYELIVAPSEPRGLSAQPGV